MQRLGGAYRHGYRALLFVCFSITPGMIPSSAAEAEQPARIVFGGDAAYPPFEWLEDGKPKGFNIDLEKALGEIGNAPVSHKLGDWPDIMRALEAGEVDVVPMFRSEEREQQFEFTSAIYYVHHLVYARNETASVYSVAELSGKSVVVEELSYAHARLEQAGLDVRIVLVDNTQEALHALAEGEADYALLGAPAAENLIHRLRLPLRSVGSPLWPREYSFAIRKDRTDLVMWVRNSLASAVTSGRFEEVYHDWEDQLRGQRYSLVDALQKAALVLMPLLLLAALLALWTSVLRRTVALRTQALQEELARREVAEEALSYAANYNRLTDLPELDYFLRLVDECLDDARETHLVVEREVVVLKLVELNRISRTFGVELANLFVQAFAKRIRDIGYAVTGYLGRGVFVVYSDKKPTRTFFKVLTESISVGDVELHPNIVAGSAFWPEHGTTAAELVRHAETAITVSASRHLEWIPYDPSMEPDPLDLRLVSDFRKSGEKGLFSVFQPQIDLRTGNVVGVEALVRWRHPALGLVLPGRFVPLLEQTGLIARVTEWMVAEAVRVAVKLREIQQDLVVSVNVASHDVMHTPLFEILNQELARRGCEPFRIKLELTETSVAEDPERMREALSRIRKSGVKVAVDDFGTGYSSLSYLGIFPIDEVKIDRDFVDGMALSPRKQSIVRSTILLAKELGMTTIAEGAEDWSTVAILREMGCDAVQGYVVSKPLPFDDLLSFLLRPGSHLSQLVKGPSRPL